MMFLPEGHVVAGVLEAGGGEGAEEKAEEGELFGGSGGPGKLDG